MVDENEAPEGYKAVEAVPVDRPTSYTCKGCAFDKPEISHPDCNANMRKDGHTVIFIKKDHTD